MTTAASAYVLVLMLFNAHEANMGILNLYTFTGVNAFGDCVANAQRIINREGGKIGGATKVKAHCERIDVPPQTTPTH